MSHSTLCCGCALASDYGTSIVTGDGSELDPYTVTQINPTFERPVVRVSRAAPTQSIPDNTPTAITFDTEAFDTDAMWTVGQPTRLVIPRDGIYLMGYTLRWTQTTATRETSFRVNGVTTLDTKSSQNSNVVAHQVSHEYQWYFTTGDYVEIMCFQLSGGALTIQADSFVPIVAWSMYMGRSF